MENEEFITIYLDYLNPFLRPEDARRVVVRYLHDLGVECEAGNDDGGPFVRYYKPPEDVFEEFSMEFFRFITSHGKK